MQERHKNRLVYFKELSITSKNYFIPYIQNWFSVEPGINVLEIGCGDGGNLLPFSEMGCNTIGVDIAASRIKDAQIFFKTAHAKGRFIAQDIFLLKELEQNFDIIICHDVLEHISNKRLFLSNLDKYLKPQGIVFMVFSCMANAIRWTSTNMQKQGIVSSAIYSPTPYDYLPASIKSFQRK